jgi:predicted ribosomally synthesized peptide with SipW-like signal peptide
MKKIKHRKIAMLLCTISLLIIGSTFAYFQKTVNVDNKFQSSQAKVYLNEKFNPNDEWVPGEEKQKEVRFGNEGQMDAVLRVRFTPVLKLQDGTEDTEEAKDFQLNFSNNFDKDWTKSGEWYYYNKVLSKDAITDVTLKSVTVSNKISNDEHGIETDYSKAVYEVKIEGELLQSSLATEAAKDLKWGLTPTVTGESVAWN